MAQIEYGDYYKFLASAGIALIAVSVALPWIFLHEPFDLAIEASKLTNFTPEGRAVILQRQHMVAALISIIPYISPLLAGIGSLMTGYGLFRWSKRQAQRDKGEDLGIEKQSKELQQMSPQEVEAKAQLELQEIEDVPRAIVPAASNTPSPINDYLAAEQAFLGRLRLCLGQSANVATNQRLAGVEYDAIIQTEAAKRIIVEIKYLTRGLSQGWLTQQLTNLIGKTALYGNTFDCEAHGVLIIILSPPQSSPPESVSEMMASLHSRFPKLSAHEFVKNEIPNISCQKLSAILSVSEAS